MLPEAAPIADADIEASPGIPRPRRGKYSRLERRCRRYTPDTNSFIAFGTRGKKQVVLKVVLQPETSGDAEKYWMRSTDRPYFGFTSLL